MAGQRAGVHEHLHVLAVGLFDFSQAGPHLVVQVVGHLGAHAHLGPVESVGIGAGLDLAQYLERQRFIALDVAAAAATGTLDVGGLAQALPLALSGHLDDAEGGHLEHAQAGAVGLQGFPERLPCR